MRYQILFCLSSDDTGTLQNPALAPMLNAAGRSLDFPTPAAAGSLINRLRRLAAGLSYYVVAIPAHPQERSAALAVEAADTLQGFSF